MNSLYNMSALPNIMNESTVCSLFTLDSNRQILNAGLFLVLEDAFYYVMLI